MSNSVYVVISPKGFILGVFTQVFEAQMCVKNNPQHEARISTEPLITR